MSPQSTVYLWLLELQEGLTVPDCEVLLPFLAQADQDKFFDHMKGRRSVSPQSLLGHAFAKIKVAEVLGVASHDLPLNFKEQGGAQVLKFNDSDWHVSLSRCDQFIALAIAPCPVGVDIEEFDREFHFLSWVDKFSEEEQFLIESCEGEEQILKFHQLWTLKEAFFKASPYSFGDVMDHAIFTVKNGEVQLELKIPQPFPSTMGHFIKGRGPQEHPPKNLELEKLTVTAFQSMQASYPSWKTNEILGGQENHPKGLRRHDWKFLLTYPFANHILALAVETRNEIAVKEGRVSMKGLLDLLGGAGQTTGVLH